MTDSKWLDQFEELVDHYKDLPTIMHKINLSLNDSAARYKVLGPNNSINVDIALRDNTHKGRKSERVEQMAKKALKVIHHMKTIPDLPKDKQMKDVTKSSKLAHEKLKYLENNGVDLIKLYRKYDNNRSGRVSYKDFGDSLVAVSSGLSKNEAHKLACAIDQEKAGSVDYHSILTRLKDLREPAEETKSITEDRSSAQQKEPAQQPTIPASVKHEDRPPDYSQIITFSNPTVPINLNELRPEVFEPPPPPPPPKDCYFPISGKRFFHHQEGKLDFYGKSAPFHREKALDELKNERQGKKRPASAPPRSIGSLRGSYLSQYEEECQSRLCSPDRKVASSAIENHPDFIRENTGRLLSGGFQFDPPVRKGSSSPQRLSYRKEVAAPNSLRSTLVRSLTGEQSLKAQKDEERRQKQEQQHSAMSDSTAAAIAKLANSNFLNKEELGKITRVVSEEVKPKGETVGERNSRLMWSSVVNQNGGRVSYLRQQLKKADQSGSGVINFKEFRAGLHSAGIRIPEPQLKEMYSSVAEKMVGGMQIPGYTRGTAVKIDEFVEQVRTRSVSDLYGRTHLERRDPHRAYNAWEELSHGGEKRGKKVEKTDVVSFTSRAKTLDEIRVMKNILRASSSYSDPAAAFNRVNENHHGLVTRDQLVQSLDGMGADLTKTQIADLVESVPTGVDGKIELSQFEDHLHQTVQSYDKATSSYAQMKEIEGNRLRSSNPNLPLKQKNNSLYSSNTLVNFDQPPYSRFQDSKTMKHERRQWSKLKSTFLSNRDLVLRAFLADKDQSLKRGELERTKDIVNTENALQEMDFKELNNRLARAGIPLGSEDKSRLQTQLQRKVSEYQNSDISVSEQQAAGKVSLNQFCDLVGIQMAIQDGRAKQIELRDPREETQDGGVFSSSVRSQAAPIALSTSLYLDETERDYRNNYGTGARKRSVPQPEYPHTADASKFWEMSHGQDNPMHFPGPIPSLREPLPRKPRAKSLGRFKQEEFTLNTISRHDASATSVNMTNSTTELDSTSKPPVSALDLLSATRGIVRFPNRNASPNMRWAVSQPDRSRVSRSPDHSVSSSSRIRNSTGSSRLGEYYVSSQSNTGSNVTSSLEGERMGSGGRAQTNYVSPALSHRNVAKSSSNEQSGRRSHSAPPRSSDRGSEQRDRTASSIAKWGSTPLAEYFAQKSEGDSMDRGRAVQQGSADRSRARSASNTPRGDGRRSNPNFGSTQLSFTAEGVMAHESATPAKRYQSGLRQVLTPNLSAPYATNYG